MLTSITALKRKIEHLKQDFANSDLTSSEYADLRFKALIDYLESLEEKITSLSDEVYMLKNKVKQ